MDPEQPVDLILMSALPGRVRLRAAVSAAGDEPLRRLAEALVERPEIIEVRANRRARSLVVRFDHAAVDIRQLAPVLQALGVRLRPPSPSSCGHPAGPDPGSGHESGGDGAAAARVARDVLRRDVRLIVPLGLGLLSLRQAARGAPGLREAPWYVLAWYAFETFRALNLGDRDRRTPAAPPRATTEES